MSSNHENSLIVTTSGLCGGLSKAITSHLVLASITFQGIVEVAFYAAVSAIVGYAVKKGIDGLTKIIKNYKR